MTVVVEDVGATVRIVVDPSLPIEEVSMTARPVRCDTNAAASSAAALARTDSRHSRKRCIAEVRSLQKTMRTKQVRFADEHGLMPVHAIPHSQIYRAIAMQCHALVAPLDREINERTAQ